MEIHDHLRTVIVAPMTSGRRPAGFRLPMTFQGVSGPVLLEQSRPLGSVSDTVLGQALKTLRELYEK